MIPLTPCQPKDPLFKDGVFLVPECKGKTETALAVTNAQQSVFPPSVCSRAGMIMGQVVPAAGNAKKVRFGAQLQKKNVSYEVIRLARVVEFLAAQPAVQTKVGFAISYHDPSGE